MDVLLQAALASASPSSTGWWRANCPYCLTAAGVDDRRRCLAIHMESGYYRCWRCHTQGRVDVQATAPDKAVEARARRTAGQLLPRIRPPRGFWATGEGPGLTSMALAEARDYLAARGVSQGVQQEAGIGATPRGMGYYDGRIVVPVLGPYGGWSGFVARDYYPAGYDRQRYLYPAGMKRGELLFNSDALQLETDEPAFIVEGVFDALPYWPDAVACLGKPSHAHEAMLRKARRPLVIALDGDAWRQGWALCQRLTLDGVQAYSMRLPPGEDPGSCNIRGRWEFAKESMVKEAVT